MHIRFDFLLDSLFILQVFLLVQAMFDHFSVSTTRGQSVISNARGLRPCSRSWGAKQEHDEHALWQPCGFHSTLKILVISWSQTSRLSSPDMKFQFCHVVLYIETHQCTIFMTRHAGLIYLFCGQTPSCSLVFKKSAVTSRQSEVEIITSSSICVICLSLLFLNVLHQSHCRLVCFFCLSIFRTEQALNLFTSLFQRAELFTLLLQLDCFFCSLRIWRI